MMNEDLPQAFDNAVSPGYDKVEQERVWNEDIAPIGLAQKEFTMEAEASRGLVKF